jgi:hypothetical protein
MSLVAVVALVFLAALVVLEPHLVRLDPRMLVELVEQVRPVALDQVVLVET